MEFMERQQKQHERMLEEQQATNAIARETNTAAECMTNVLIAILRESLLGQ